MTMSGGAAGGGPVQEAIRIVPAKRRTLERSRRMVDRCENAKSDGKMVPGHMFGKGEVTSV